MMNGLGGCPPNQSNGDIEMDKIEEMLYNLLGAFITRNTRSDGIISPMDASEFNRITDAWSFSAEFLAKMLGRGKDTIYSYRAGRLRIPPTAADRIRQLDFMMNAIRNDILKADN